MTPAETLAVYIPLIGIPVFALAVLAYACAVAAKRGDEQDGRDRQVRGAGRVIRRGSSSSSDRGGFITGPPSHRRRVEPRVRRLREREPVR